MKYKRFESDFFDTVYYIPEEGVEPTIVYKQMQEPSTYKYILFFKKHREGGLPAMVGGNGRTLFYDNNYAHRFIGPAIGSNWFIRSKRLNAEEYFVFLDQNGIDINNLSDNDKLLILMRFGYG